MAEGRDPGKRPGFAQKQVEQERGRAWGERIKADSRESKHVAQVEGGEQCQRKPLCERGGKWMGEKRDLLESHWRPSTPYTLLLQSSWLIELSHMLSMGRDPSRSLSAF